MSCKKCKCKVCSCIGNEQVKIAVNKIIQNPDEKDVVNIKVPTKTSDLINDSGFGQGGDGGGKIEEIRVNGVPAPIQGKIAIITVPTKTSDLTNDSNFVSKSYVDSHIINKNNPHNVTKEQLNLGNVDNTSDLNKPISTATQNALNTKLNVLDVKSEVIYQDLKPVNSQAVMNWSTQKINNIAELRQTIGKEEGQVVELLGYYEAGEYSLKYKWTNTQETDDGGAVINVSNGSWIAQFKENKIIIDFFGAKTSITDNTPYINNAINYCNSIATITNEVNLIVPDSNGTYKCANKLTKINRYINLKCYSELELTSVINDVFIEIGDYLNNSSNVGRSHIIRAFRTNFSNLSQIYDKLNNVGVRLINDSTSNNSIVKIWGFYIGLELYGSYEISYNKYYLTKLACNVIDIDLNKQANGWINENIFFGGSFSLFSGESNKLYKKHCVRVRSNDDYKNNSNLMIKPSFEAHPNGVPNDSYVIRLDNASGFKIIDARLESTPTFFAYEGVDNRGFYSFTYIHNTSVSTNITKIKAPNGSTSIVENNMNKGSYFYNSGDLSEKIKSTSSITVFKDTLGFMAASVDEKLLTKTSSKTSGGVVLNNDKTLKTNTQGVALTIKNINEGDSFFVKLNSLSGGRIFIKAYNNLGEVIDYGVGTSFQLFDESSSYSSRFGVCWGLQSDIEKTSFSVTSSDVSKVVLLFRSNDLISFLVNKIEGKNACIDNSHRSSSLYSHRVNTSASLTVDSLTDYIRVNNLTSNITLSLPVDTTNSLSNIRIRLDNLNGYNVVVSTGASSRTFNKNNTNIYMFKSETYYQFEGVYSDMVSSSNVENVTSADATDLTTALTLVNELKSKLNAKLTADRNSGQQAIQ